MARHHPHPPRKQRTREHILADLSANHVERFALQCGFAVERVSKDYGIDLLIFTFDEYGFYESGLLWLQLKATDRLKKSRDGKHALIRLDRRDILAWIAEAYPVILTLYDADAERAYWLWIQQYFGDSAAFAKLRGATVTVPIPTRNVVTATAMRQFADAKAAIVALPGGRA